MTMTVSVRVRLGWRWKLATCVAYAAAWLRLWRIAVTAINWGMAGIRFRVGEEPWSAFDPPISVKLTREEVPT